MRLNNLSKLEQFAPYGVIFIRFAFGCHLLHYTWEDIFSLSAGLNNSEMLAGIGIPFPIIMSWIYVSIQFLGGIALIVGYKTRLFAIPLIIIFLVAYFLVHFQDDYGGYFQALQMLAVSFFFLFNGSGVFSLDKYLNKIKSKELLEERINNMDTNNKQIKNGEIL